MASSYNYIKNKLYVYNYGWHNYMFLYDLLIIHRRDMFDPDHTLKLLVNHNLQYGELGWTQMLCEPYDITLPVSYHGYATITRYAA